MINLVMMRYLTLCLSFLCLISATGETKKPADVKRVPLLRADTIFPGSACVTQGKLFFTERPDEGAEEARGLFSLSSGGTVTRVMAIDGVRGLHCAKEGPVIEALVQPGELAVHFLVVKDAKLTPATESDFPYLAEEGALRLALLKAGQAIADTEGQKLRSATMVGLRWASDNFQRWLTILESPAGIAALPRFWVGFQNKESQKLPQIVALPLEEGDTITSDFAWGNDKLIVHLRDSSNHSVIQIVDLLTGKATFRSKPDTMELHRVTAVTSVAGGGFLVADNDSFHKKVAQLWRFDEAGQLGPSNFPPRDITAFSAQPEGLLISRRSGIEWHGTELEPLRDWKVNTLSPIAEERRDCHSHLLIAQADGTHLLYQRDRVLTGIIETIPLARFSRVADFACLPGFIAVTGQMKSHFDFKGHLEVEIEQADINFPEKSNSFFDFDDERDSKNRLFIFRGGRLIHRRAFPDQTTSGTISVAKDQFKIAVNIVVDGKPVPYIWDLLMSADGKYAAPQLGRGRLASPVMARSTVAPSGIATEKANQELTVLNVSKVAKQKIVSLKSDRFEPALGVISESTKSIYYSEFATNGCRGRNVHKRELNAPTSDEPSVIEPKPVLTLPCVLDLFLQDSQVFVAYWNDQKLRRLKRLGAASDSIADLFPGRSYLVQWEIDAMMKLEPARVNFEGQHWLAAFTEPTHGTLIMFDQANASLNYVIFPFSGPASFPGPTQQKITPLDTKASLTFTKSPEFARALVRQSGNAIMILGTLEDGAMAQLLTVEGKGKSGQLQVTRQVGRDFASLEAPNRAIPFEKWAIREAGLMTATPYGLVIVDASIRIAESPGASYCSSHFTGDAATTFTRLPWVDTRAITGLDVSSQGLVVTDLDSKEIYLVPFKKAAPPMSSKGGGSQ